MRFLLPLTTVNYQYADTTQLILKAFYKVHNTLGYGFLEKVYENAMRIELQRMGLACTTQQPIDVYYGTDKVGLYYADMVLTTALS